MTIICTAKIIDGNEVKKGGNGLFLITNKNGCYVNITGAEKQLRGKRLFERRGLSEEHKRAIWKWELKNKYKK